MPLRYFGLDGEMTGSELTHGHRLIQLGLAAHQHPDGTPADIPDTISLLLNPGPAEWTDVAEAVHGFTRDQVATAIPATQADTILETWLLDHGAQPNKRIDTIPVGFNVGSFDMPHVAAVLPRTYALFSRRTLDLNAICFTLDGTPDPTSHEPWSWSTWKKRATHQARTMIAATNGNDQAAHDAGYDALLHLYAWRYLQSICRGITPTTPDVTLVDPPVREHLRALTAIHSIDELSRLTGVPDVFLTQWGGGGRATNTTYLNALHSAYDALTTTP